MNTKISILILFISILALFLRFAYIETTVIDTPVRADAASYVAYGANLALHGTYSKEFPSQNPTPDSIRSPGYPFLISLIIKLVGKQNWYNVLLYSQAIISALLVLLTYYLGTYFLSYWASICAAMLVALSPHLISIPSYILTETLFSFLFLLSLLSFHSALSNHRWRYFALSGLFFGYAYLINQTIFFLPLILALIIFLEKKSYLISIRGKLASSMIIFLVCFTIFFGAWSVRNKVSIPPSGNKGTDRALSTLTHGTYPGFVYKSLKYKYFPYKEDPKQPEYGDSLNNFISVFSKRFKERSLRYVTWYLFEKPYYFWSWNILQGQGDVYIYPVRQSLYTISKLADSSRKFMKWLHPVLLILTLSGVIIFIWRWMKGKINQLENSSGLIFICIIYYTALYSVFASWPRYSIPFRPELYLFAIWSLMNWLELFKKRIVKEYGVSERD